MFVLILLICTIFDKYAAPYHTEGCSSQKRADYISRNLTQECTSSLTALQHHLQRSVQVNTNLFIPVATDLDTICQLSCAGAYSNWLRNDCKDPHSSRMIEATCIYTAGTTNIGDRCRSAFPDAFDGIRNMFNEVFTCGLRDMPGSCPLKCHAAMSNLISTLGCCYQSLYNNTDFILYLLDVGVINETHAASLEYLGRVNEWEACKIGAPPMCEVIAFSPINSASQLSALSIISLHIIGTALLTIISSML